MVATVRKITAPKITSDLVKYEEELAYSRETAGVVKLDTVVDLGTPIALDADHKTVALPADGTLACIGVSLSVRAATAADTIGDITYIRRQAILADSGIAWPAGISDANKAKALADIEIRGVVVRAAV